MSRPPRVRMTRVEMQDIGACEPFPGGATLLKYYPIAPTRRGIRSIFPSLRTLAAIRIALAAMSDEELAAMHMAAEEMAVAPGTAGLYDAIDHVCDWEQLRRRGFGFALQHPREAIPDEGMADALFALDGLRSATEDYPNVDALLKAIGEALAPPPAVQ